MAQGLRVGDRVIAKENGPPGKWGRIVAIDPFDRQLLVDFPGWNGGHTADDYWHKSWYPEEYKNQSRSRRWFHAPQLESFEESLPEESPAAKNGNDFRAGDWVMATGGRPNGRTGEILLLKPDIGIATVEFSGWGRGHNADGSWRDPGYPQNRKTESRDRWNCLFPDLKLVKRAGRSSEASGGDPVIRIIENESREKIICDEDGDEVRVETSGSLYGFRSGDIISDGDDDSQWYEERVIVEGFRDGEELWGRIEGDDEAQYSSEPDGLFLLERPGWRFKVGDSARAVSGPAAGCRGEVIVINPEKNYLYLVHFPGWEGGNSTISEESKAWFPEEYREGASFWKERCLWLEEHELEAAA